MKWHGAIGYAETKETRPGIWEDSVTEKQYCGDVIRNSRRLQSSDKLNDDIVVNNEISIVSDPFLNQNFHKIKYIEFMGTKWTVSNVDVQYPRLLLTLGSVYNGPTA